MVVDIGNYSGGRVQRTLPEEVPSSRGVLLLYPERHFQGGEAARFCDRPISVLYAWVQYGRVVVLTSGSSAAL